MTEDECLLAFGKPQTIQESNGESAMDVFQLVLPILQEWTCGNDYQIIP